MWRREERVSPGATSRTGPNDILSTVRVPVAGKKDRCARVLYTKRCDYYEVHGFVRPSNLTRNYFVSRPATVPGYLPAYGHEG